LDLLLIAVALVMTWRACRAARPALWELAAIVLMAALTIKASRDGVWLLFLLAASAARGGRVRRDWLGLVPVVAACALALLCSDIAGWLRVRPATPPAITAALRLAHGSPILAESTQAEQVALAGGTIWVGNPVDAFSDRVQNAYLNWIDGDADGSAILANTRIRVVVTAVGSAADTLTAADRTFAVIRREGGAVVYERKG
ncbi:MAG: hypothetical protein ACRDKL_11105, partial [Solirubrobacteraceae bacterium]